MKDDNNSNWEETKKHLKAQLTDLSYKTFVEPMQFHAKDDIDRAIYISWPEQPQLTDHVNFHYSDIIQKAVNAIWGTDYTVVIQSEDEYKKNEGSFADCDIKASRLNNDYRFDTFVGGESNKDAFSAAQIAAGFPGASYNPLLIYGDSGLGKTHLLHAAASHIEEHDPDLEVLYMSAEAFADRLAEFAELGTLHLFKERMQRCDVLIIDDIQYMKYQDTVQEAFIDIIGDMYEKQKQIIIGGNYVATEIMGLDIRLKKRFAACVTTEISQPEFEIKKAVLMNLANKQDVEMTEDIKKVIDYIADISAPNLFEVQGAFKRVLAYAQLSEEPITLSNARHILEPISGAVTEAGNIIEEDVLSRESAGIACVIRNVISRIKNRLRF